MKKLLLALSLSVSTMSLFADIFDAIPRDTPEEVLDQILASQQKGENINQLRVRGGFSPLTYAVEYGNTAAIELLVEVAGADINSTDDQPFRRSALVAACRRYHTNPQVFEQIIKYLVEHGANTRPAGHPLLHMYPSFPMLQYLVQHGVDLKFVYQTSAGSQTVLDFMIDDYLSASFQSTSYPDGLRNISFLLNQGFPVDRDTFQRLLERIAEDASIDDSPEQRHLETHFALLRLLCSTHFHILGDQSLLNAISQLDLGGLRGRKYESLMKILTQAPEALRRWQERQFTETHASIANVLSSYEMSEPQLLERTYGFLGHNERPNFGVVTRTASSRRAGDAQYTAGYTMIQAVALTVLFANTWFSIQSKTTF